MDGEKISFTEYSLKNVVGDISQVAMFSDDPKTFRGWLDEPPKFDKKKHIR